VLDLHSGSWTQRQTIPEVNCLAAVVAVVLICHQLVPCLYIYIIYKSQNLDRKDLVCLFLVIIIEVFIKAQNLFRKDLVFIFLVIIIKVSIKSKILFVTRLL